MVTDLQVKAEMYEAKASKCRELARRATDEHQRALYEVLAGYHGRLAADFRQVLAKQESSPSAETAGSNQAALESA